MSYVQYFFWNLRKSACGKAESVSSCYSNQRASGYVFSDGDPCGFFDLLPPAEDGGPHLWVAINETARDEDFAGEPKDGSTDVGHSRKNNL